MNKKLGLGLAVAVLLLVVAGVLAFLHMHPPQPIPPAAPPPAARPAQPAAPQAPFACVAPENPPGQPDGATATAAQMKAGHDAIQHYVELLEAYQACRNKQIDDPTSTASAAQKQTWLNDGNDAVDEANLLAAQFSAQLKIWRARNPGK